MAPIFLPRDVVEHKGIFKKTATTSEAVFMITGLTIGAGILGLPFVISRSGLVVGLLLIAVWGLVIMLLNLMLGDIVVRTSESFQLPGLAGKYLGKFAKIIASFIIIFAGFGSLLAYVIGEGQALAAIFGGQPMWWSVVFWSIASFFVWQGLDSIKKVDRILSLTVIIIIVGLSLFLLPKIDPINLEFIEISNFFLPFGVILFALHAAPAIAEAHAVLPGSKKRFKRAIVIGTMVPTVVYILFSLAIVGYFGLNTSEVATIGLSEAFGRPFGILANSFAALAMTTGFLGMGLALKQVLIWDHKIRKSFADFAVISIPILLFLFGFRSFVAVLDFVGGLFIGIESLLIVMICYQARRKGDLDGSRFGLQNFWLIAIPVILFFVVATIYSVFKFF